MGTRGNVYVHEGSAPGVYLYQHSDAYRLDATVAHGLKRGEGRRSDTPYLTRVLFCQMIAEGSDSPSRALDDTAGFGIDTALGDGDDRIVDVDTAAGTVRALDGETRTMDAHVEKFYLQ